MTHEQPAVQRVLRRRSDDRVIGGVASGLGDYFNVDPLLVRIVFVGLMVFGGMGILLYLTAWLLIPDDASDRSVIERVLGRGGLGGALLAVLLVLVAGSAFFSIAAGLDYGGGDGFGFFGFALAVILVGALILRRNEPRGAAVVDTGTEAGSESTSVAPAVRRPRGDPSPLGGYVLGSALAGVGALALIANATGAEVTLAHYFGLALGVVGIGLLIGAWWGHARGLILLGLLLLPFAIPAGFVTAPLEGGFGDLRYTPASAEELQDEYRLAGGQLILDLTDLPADEPVAVAASVAMGELVVRVPDGASVEVDATVNAGSMTIFGARQSGTNLADQQAVDGDGPQYSLDLDAGIGRISVESVSSEDRER